MNRPKMKYALLILTLALLTALVLGCGKKGNPTLKSYEKPDTPTGLSAVHRQDSVLLTWEYPPSKEYLIEKFIVMRSEGSDFSKLATVDATLREYSDKDIRAGNIYGYRVLSQNARSVSSNDSAGVTASVVQPPPPPQRLSYKVTGDTVTISWKPVDSAGLYNVYRRTSQGSYGMKPINQAPLSVPFFKDAFSIRRVHHYIVRSLTGGSVRNEGAASEELAVDAADIIPPMPLNLRAFPASDKVILVWTGFDDLWLTGYNVYRKTGSNDFVLIGKTQTPAFLDPEAPTAKRQYRVTGVGTEKEGPAAEISDVIFIPQP